MQERISVSDYLKNLSPAILAICKPLRAMARTAIPKANEFIYHNAINYSLTDSPFDRICYIAPQNEKYVNFGFFFGAGLPDPEGLIEGRGTKMRHVKIHSAKNAKNPALQKIINAAWKNSGRDITEWRQSLKRTSKIAKSR